MEASSMASTLDDEVDEGEDKDDEEAAVAEAEVYLLGFSMNLGFVLITLHQWAASRPETMAKPRIFAIFLRETTPRLASD